MLLEYGNSTFTGPSTPNVVYGIQKVEEWMFGNVSELIMQLQELNPQITLTGVILLIGNIGPPTGLRITRLRPLMHFKSISMLPFG